MVGKINTVQLSSLFLLFYDELELHYLEEFLHSKDPDNFLKLVFEVPLAPYAEGNLSDL